MLDRAGLRGRLERHRRPRPRARRRRLRADPDPRRRAGGAAARTRRVPLACGCIGQETTGAGGLAQGAAHGAGGARDRRARARAGRAGRLDRRLHEPGRDRHARAARRRPPRGRPLQRRDRLPAARSRGCSASSRSGVVVDQVGLNHLTWVRAVRLDGDDVLPAAARRARRRARRAGSALPRAAARRARRRPVLLPALLLRARRGARRAAGRRDAARATVVAEIERELLELYRDPALTEKPALLEQRGGAFYSEAAVGLVALARDRRRRRARGRRAQRRHARRARRRRRRRGAGARRPRRRRCRCRRRRSRRSCSASSSTSPPTSGSPPRPRSRGDRSTARKALLAHPLIGQHDDGWSTLLERARLPRPREALA